MLYFYGIFICILFSFRISETSMPIEGLQRFSETPIFFSLFLTAGSVTSTSNISTGKNVISFSYTLGEKRKVMI